jgi:GT2 family glycosyltransferase
MNRLVFFLHTALEKSILALFGRYIKNPSKTSPSIVLPCSPTHQSLAELLENWDEQAHPYLSPFFHPADLDRVVSSLPKDGQAEILYFDHCLENHRMAPFLKPNWSPELWLNVDLLFGAAYQASFLRQLANQGDEKLIARAILRAKQIKRVPNMIIQTPDYPWQIAEQAHLHRQTVQDYLNLIGVRPPNIDFRPNGSLRFHWSLSEELVSIVIPNRNNLSLLKRCIDSIYSHTDYPNYEILVVDDHSTDADVLKYYQQQKREKWNFRVLEGEKPFNFSRACNQGAKAASGAFVLFLNNDTEVLHADWLTNLVGVAKLPGVGAVGAKLIYPNGKVQHAGVVIGLEGHASHVFQGVSNDPFTPYGYVNWMRNVSAVTAACMLLPRDAFWEVGGFEEQFQIAFGDIDLCLRLRDAGYRVVYSPDACLIHHEGKSRGKYIPAQDIRAKADYFLQKVAEGDPYYHPALSRAWRIPTLRWRWEQDPLLRLKKIIQLLG